jgi:hypothetical protein
MTTNLPNHPLGAFPPPETAAYILDGIIDTDMSKRNDDTYLGHTCTQSVIYCPGCRPSVRILLPAIENKPFEAFVVIQESRELGATTIKDRKYDRTVVLPLMKWNFSCEDLYRSPSINNSKSRDPVK